MILVLLPVVVNSSQANMPAPPYIADEPPQPSGGGGIGSSSQPWEFTIAVFSYSSSVYSCPVYLFWKIKALTSGSTLLAFVSTTMIESFDIVGSSFDRSLRIESSVNMQSFAVNTCENSVGSSRND